MKKKKKNLNEKPKEEPKPLRRTLEQIVTDFKSRRRTQGPDDMTISEVAAISVRANELTPPAYRNTEMRKLPCSAAIVDQVMKHPIGERGLRLMGDTGSGKTRLAWLLLQKFYVTGGRFTALDGVTFSADASHAYREGSERIYFGALRKSRLLFIDDIGKGKMTARVTEALFTVIDQRAQRKLPTLLTMNYTLESFKRKLLSTEETDPETVEALMRRMREELTTILVTKQ